MRPHNFEGLVVNVHFFSEQIRSVEQTVASTTKPSRLEEMYHFKFVTFNLLWTRICRATLSHHNLSEMYISFDSDINFHWSILNHHQYLSI